MVYCIDFTHIFHLIVFHIYCHFVHFSFFSYATGGLWPYISVNKSIRWTTCWKTLSQSKYPFLGPFIQYLYSITYFQNLRSCVKNRQFPLLCDDSPPTNPGGNFLNQIGSSLIYPLWLLFHIITPFIFSVKKAKRRKESNLLNYIVSEVMFLSIFLFILLILSDTVCLKY